jgi:DNA-binding transcriptional MerR regulator
VTERLVRFYVSTQLLDAPTKDGREAIYGALQLAKLVAVRVLLSGGLSLSRIKEIVARRLDKGLRDDRLGFVTITDVRVTGDLQHATVFFTVYGDDVERQNSWDALKSATGMLRSEVGRNITAR